MEKFAIWVIAWLSFCICLFLAWFFSHRAKHRERMLMIEKGLNPTEEGKKNKNVQSLSMKLGLVILGLGFGLAVIAFLANFGILGRSDAMPIAILALSGGGALIFANYIENRRN
ncbi:DUF6249 domain-containing protein [Pedobacter montanisoli]|uniref:DUF6249 domain-containing protein n=1 Tax=Pedobacter montanisoli TaxID=2923277 RepID=A0ABS9ZUF6_9SPHI|nr:DUF6249 domain-containing protein [Pedobacter montanisoli]MCJ0742216.1 hypothetical protein [Pedobacter montanisoli]